jgi:hypothetical protein
LNRRQFLTGLLSSAAVVTLPPAAGGDYVLIIDPWSKRLVEELLAYRPPPDDLVEPLFEGRIGVYCGIQIMEGDDGRANELRPL